MLPHFRSGIPVAIIGNFVEAHIDFLGRATDVDERELLIAGEAAHADRALLWAGDPKLTFVSQDIPHAHYLCSRLGYDSTRYVAPQNPTDSLCEDILREDSLLEELERHAGMDRRLQLIPYATTMQFLELASTLQERCNLTVLLPESPKQESHWLRDFVDSKSGFHLLAGRWLPNADERLPEAYFCVDIDQAALTAQSFLSGGRSCIVKPDRGESGIGSTIISPDNFSNMDQIVQSLRSVPFWGEDLLLVEEFIAAARPTSPSVEIFVPLSGAGKPEVTYISEQLFREYGEFRGVLVSRELLDRSWYQTCVESGLRLANKLQERGYAGHFDIDGILDEKGDLYLLELNARRTGGTHVHDFARHYFGDGYLEHVTLLSWEGVDSGPISSFEELLVALEGLMFPLGKEERGIIVTVSSMLKYHSFGVMIVGADTDDVVMLQQELSDRMSSHAG